MNPHYARGLMRSTRFLAVYRCARIQGTRTLSAQPAERLIIADTRPHNLKHVTVEMPRKKLEVIARRVD